MVGGGGGVREGVEGEEVEGGDEAGVRGCGSGGDGLLAGIVRYSRSG